MCMGLELGVLLQTSKTEGREKMESTLSKVYVRINEQGYIVACDGGYTTPEILDKWTKIDEGIGDRYNLAQSNYFDKPIVTMGGAYRYKLVNGKPVECTEEEIQEQEEANKPLQTPSLDDRVTGLEEAATEQETSIRDLQLASVETYELLLAIMGV